MKKGLLIAICGCAMGTAIAQGPVSDTVSTGASYANQIWYQLETGAETAAAKTDWDIAFKTEAMSVAIFTNAGTQLWKYPTGDTAAWATVDTAGISAWEEGVNAETDWEVGALNAVAGADQFDYGWGTYDMVTHNITGHVIFIIKLVNGDYKKLWIRQLVSTTGTYTFTYANLDGTDQEEVTFLKSDYAGKDFGYYSLSGNQAADLEPASEDWDLYFTQYTAMVEMGPDVIVPYGVTGVLASEGVELIQVDEVDQETYVDYESETFSTEKNIIGYDWKTYDMESGSYLIADSTVFFAKDKAGSIWKLVFTGFGGSATGDFILNKEKLAGTSITAGHAIASFAMYPNPATNGYVHVAYTLAETAAAQLQVYNYAGQVVAQQSIKGANGLNTTTIATQGWAQGMYFISLEVAGRKVSQKIIVK